MNAHVQSKKYIKSEKTDIQLVEPHNHRVNAAETAIKSGKYQSIAHFATLDPECPIQLWCKFSPQIEITLNILRTSRQNNKNQLMKIFMVKNTTGIEHQWRL